MTFRTPAPASERWAPRDSLGRMLWAAKAGLSAMDARGFASGARRTWAQRAPWRVADSLVVLAALRSRSLCAGALRYRFRCNQSDAGCKAVNKYVNLHC